MLNPLTKTQAFPSMIISMMDKAKQSLFAIGTSLLLFGCSSEPAPSGQSGNVSEQVKPTSTSIDEIFDTYEANQIAGAKKFEGKPLQLAGKAVRIREAMGTGFIILSSLESGREQEFGFTDAGTALLANVSPGDSVTITCPGVVEAMGMILIAGCSSLEVN